MRHIRESVAALMIASAIALGTGAAKADPVELRFASPSPLQGQTTVWGLRPWIDDMTKASDGTLEVKLFAGVAVANFNNVYDRIIDGAFDIGFGVFGALSGQFTKTDVATLPFEAENATESSVALWRLYQSGVIASEFTKVKLLGFVTFAGSDLNTKRELRTVEDLKGVRLAVFSRGNAREAELLGAAPISMAPNDGYSAVQHGLADGIIVGLSAFGPFKYEEVVNCHLKAPAGQATAFLFMNKASYAKLTGKAKEAVDKFAYENLSLRMGQVSDRMEDEVANTVAKMPGHKVYEFGPDQLAVMKAKLDPINDAWVKATPDGAAVLEAYRKEIAKYRATH
jgi:TRAP-type C4-dicarboxylate transport system substrate-binding protein